MTDPTPARPANRLIHETSPYLLQHAYNPVDWYPWGEEALQAANERDMPIFLSIGYSACHWCHVMEHESFESEDIAAAMNERFICIKVDREERPDLDQIYMNAVQLLTGRGGWPMSVFLTPDLRPFYGGTYWPPTARMGMPGFSDILTQVHQAWESRRETVFHAAEDLTAAVVKAGLPSDETADLSVSLLENAQRKLLRAADRRYGGIGSAPKFPHAMDLRLLLRCAQRFDSADAQEVALLTLDRMADGGIYDHLGGGFHRYSTDERWLVPHFEKMLYDNALLVPAYLEAFQITGNPRYATVSRETVDYVLREMTHPDGGFYSTQDADSEGVEGKFFVWTADEISQHLSEDDAQLFAAEYDVRPGGNWEGHTILNRSNPPELPDDLAALPVEELESRLAKCRETLFAVRERRIKPGRDEKILTGWNGLMISAAAQAARVLDESAYAAAATNAAEFLWQHLRSESGQLLHTWKDGRGKLNAYLDDYSCAIDGLTELYFTTFEPLWLERATELSRQMSERYEDPESGGFFFTSADHEQLIARYKDIQDGATPSGNSMAATALLKLSQVTGDAKLAATAERTLTMMSGLMSTISLASGQGLLAVDFLLGPTYEIAVCEGNDATETESVIRSLHEKFMPRTVIAKRPSAWTEADIPEQLTALLRDRPARDGRVSTYVCRNHTCQEPILGPVDWSTAFESE